MHVIKVLVWLHLDAQHAARKDSEILQVGGLRITTFDMGGHKTGANLFLPMCIDLSSHPSIFHEITHVPLLG